MPETLHDIGEEYDEYCSPRNHVLANGVPNNAQQSRSQDGQDRLPSPHSDGRNFEDPHAHNNSSTDVFLDEQWVDAVIQAENEEIEALVALQDQDQASARSFESDDEMDEAFAELAMNMDDMDMS